MIAVSDEDIPNSGAYTRFKLISVIKHYIGKRCFFYHTRAHAKNMRIEASLRARCAEVTARISHVSAG